MGESAEAPPPRESAADEKRVLVGKIVGLSGVKGEVKLESYTEPRTKIFSYEPWLLKSALGESEIMSGGQALAHRQRVGARVGRQVDARDAGLAAHHDSVAAPCRASRERSPLPASSSSLCSARRVASASKSAALMSPVM